MPTNDPPPDATTAGIEALQTRLRDSVDRVCPRWLRGQADDIVQVALMRVLDVCKEGGGFREFPSSYLMKAAYSAAVDEIRRHHRRKETSLEDQPELSLPASRIANPEQQSTSREITRGISDCLLAMAAARRRAVTLHLLGYSVPEAGRALGCGMTRAEHLVYRGLADLRRCLESKGLKP